MILRRRNLSRLKEIGTILARHGWGHVASRLGLARLLHLRGTASQEQGTPARLVQALEELGPTFIKFGQLLSTRSDLLPQGYIEELSKLQDTAPTIPIAYVREVISTELGGSPETIFAEFNDVPIAAASLGQVHSAVLHDGTQVIIKVQRPGIRDVVDRDIEILYTIASMLERRWERAKTYGLTEVVDEFAITIREELDYTREAYNTQRLRTNLSKENRARVPQVYWELVTQRVLTLERINGIKITDERGLEALGIDIKDAANALTSIFLHQIFVDGFFHADPHPGNILVTPDHQIALIDCGQVRQLDASARTGLLRLMISFEHQQTRRFAEEIEALGISSGDVDLQALTRDLEKILRQYYDIPSRLANVGQILMRVMDVSARHKIRLPVEFAVLGKVLANIDGINRLLNSDFNFTEALRPYISRAVREQFAVDEMLTDAYRTVIDIKNLILSLPEYLDQLLHKAVEGSLRLEFRHKGLDELESRLDKISNRLSFALIVGAIIIGSSIIVVSNQGPTSIFGLPALGVAGYVIATILGVWLLISIIRSGRL